MKYLHERRQALGGYLPKRRTKADESFTVPSLETFKAVLDATAEGREISTTQAYRALPDATAARQGAGPARGADPGRRGAHLRHGRPVPPDRHLQPRGAEVHAGRQGPGDVLPRGQGRPDPAGGHQRGRRHEQLDRRGHQLQHQQPHHGAVLRLLLDVRLPAHRRPGLGRRRHAGARLPARRHLGPHHAQRRGPAARGRPQPHPGRHHSQLHQLRPDLRARGRRDPAPWPEAHGREAGQRLLLPHAAERELPDAGPEGRHRGADHQGHVPARGGREEDAARQPAGQRHHPARDRRPPRELLREATGAWPPTCGAARASTS